MIVRLDQMFAVQASTTPHSPALYFRGRTISYAELAGSVDVLSEALSHYGVGPGVLVALGLKRTPDLIALVLAILKAGGAYLPLDPRYPQERVRFVLADSGSSVLIIDEDFRLPPDFARTVLQLTGGALIERSQGPSPGPGNLPSDLAYVIYTSGSTGEPKGVMLGHGASHLVQWAKRTYSPHDLSRVAATTSLCFDPSVFELFAPLCTGGALILKENALEPFRSDEHPTTLNTAPSILAELCRTGAIPSSLTVLNVGGEVLRGDLVREAYRVRPNLALYNHYGPTEATTCATVARMTPDLIGDPPIGRPVRDAEILLLDTEGRAVAEGEIGEIHIGGQGLALGYLNRPALTAACFIQSPFGRLYRTGDLGCRRDGDLYFGGRLDRQVKVRGFRIELGEVEAALMRLPRVQSAIAKMSDRGDRSQLIGYVQSDEPLTETDIRSCLAEWLPDYMIPARILVMRRLPLLVSGKIDHKALPQVGDEPEVCEPGPVMPAEKPIIQVFEDVLGRKAVGPQESFFDLGGDSLSSVWAALRLSEILGYDIAAALIHQAPTPRALALALGHGRVRTDGHIGLLGGDGVNGVGAPLFCMADLFGHPFNYLSLARRLGAEHPVYGVSPGPRQQAFTLDRDLRSLAQAYVTELRRIQLQGPYVIAGYSAGGLFAFEVAAGLERDGQPVCLILLDSYLYSLRPSIGSLAKWVSKQSVALFKSGEVWRMGRQIPVLAAGLIRQLMTGKARPPSWIPRSQLGYAAALIKAGLGFKPAPFHGPTLIIKARDSSRGDQLFDQDGQLGWSSALKGKVSQQTVEGGHHQFLREPFVAETTATIRRYLVDVHGYFPEREDL